MASNGLPDGGVLSHDDGSSTSEGHPNLLHLFGADIVNVDHEEPGVLVKQRLCVETQLPREMARKILSLTTQFQELATYQKFHKVVSLPCGFVFPAHLECESRIALYWV